MLYKLMLSLSGRSARAECLTEKLEVRWNMSIDVMAGKRATKTSDAITNSLVKPLLSDSRLDAVAHSQLTCAPTKGCIRWSCHTCDCAAFSVQHREHFSNPHLGRVPSPSSAKKPSNHVRTQMQFAACTCEHLSGRSCCCRKIFPAPCPSPGRLSAA